MSSPAVADSKVRRWRPRGGTGRDGHAPLLGDAVAGRLLPVHALHSIGETMFGVSLAGSLFFNVSVDAARPRIALYLAITMAPFAVLAPLVGPVIDRVRGGHRVVLLTTLVGRSVLAVLLATELKGLLFYPEAFAMLVLAKTYQVSRNSIVPLMVGDRSHLVIVNSRLARTGTVAGLLASPFAVLILQGASAAWVLRAGAVAYGIGAVLALRLPATHYDPVSTVVERTELSAPSVRSAALGMAAMRAAIGFALFHVGFQMKRAGEPTWMFGALAGTNALGGFTGTFVAPWLRRRVGERAMLTIALALPVTTGFIAALRYHRITVLWFAFSMGLAGSVARRAFDGVVQTDAPHARRGLAYARLETGLELAWVLGALVAVAGRLVDWVGLAALAVFLGACAAYRALVWWSSVRTQAAVQPATLPLRLLETADALAAQGDREQAALVAIAAADAVPVVAASCVPRLDELRRLGAEAARGDDPDLADEVLHLAHEIVGDVYAAESAEGVEGADKGNGEDSTESGDGAAGGDGDASEDRDAGGDTSDGQDGAASGDVAAGGDTSDGEDVAASGEVDGEDGRDSVSRGAGADAAGRGRARRPR